MLFELLPYEYRKSVFDIDYNKLYSLGYRVLLFDLDNTLVHHGDPADDRICDFFKGLHEIGYKTVIVSDNEEKRTAPFAEKVGTLYITDAEKPSPKAFLKALEIAGAQKSSSVVIGDQMFKDILGANRSGIPSIMVKYIKLPGEGWPGIKRILEFIILFFGRLFGYNHRIGDI